MTENLYPLPNNWRWSKLKEVCTFVGGGTPSKKNPEYWNGNIFWASVKDIKGDYLFDTIDKISEEGLNNSTANLCEVDDLILITRIEPAKTTVSKIVTAINQDLKIVKSPLPSKFLHYFFQNFKDEIELLARGSTVKGITIESLNNFPIPVPPLETQKRIVEILDKIFLKLNQAEEKLNLIVGYNDLKNNTIGKIAIMKKSILARAFRGKLF